MTTRRADYVGGVLDRLERLCDGYILQAQQLVSGDRIRLREQWEHARKKLRGTDGATVKMRIPLAEKNNASMTKMDSTIAFLNDPVIDEAGKDRDAFMSTFLNLARNVTKMFYICHSLCRV